MKKPKKNKYIRSVKCYFTKWLTASKKQELREYLSEMHKMVNNALINYEQEILDSKSKFDFQKLKLFYNVDSWLLARARRHAYAEAYSLVKGTKTSSDALKSKYSTPTHNPNQINISDIDIKIIQNTGLKDFDLLLEIRCFDSRVPRNKARTLAIPLKKNKLFNKWLNFPNSKLNNAVIITDKYIQFSFEITVPKKTSGDVAGFDPGAKNTLTDSNGVHYGQGLWDLLTKLSRKQKYSNAWYRCKEEIKEYIDKTCKDIPWETLEYLILEDNTNIKYKSKLKGRLSKNMRSFLSNWSIGRIDNRIQMLSEANGVRLRRVPAFNNSTKCPICGHCEKANRASQDSFICLECGHTEHADVVGAINVLARYALGKYGSECKSRFIKKNPDFGSKILGSLVFVGFNMMKVNGQLANPEDSNISLKHQTCTCGHDITAHGGFKNPYDNSCFYSYNCDCKAFDP